MSRAQGCAGATSGQKKWTNEKAAPVAAPRNFSAVPCAPRQSRAARELAERERHALRAQTPRAENPRLWLRCSTCSRGIELQPRGGFYFRAQSRAIGGANCETISRDVT